MHGECKPLPVKSPSFLVTRAAIFVSVATFTRRHRPLNAEARADFVKAMSILTNLSRVLAKLSPDEKQKLRKAQRAWVASGDAEAAEAAKETEGASIAPTVRYGRMRELTLKRIAELNALIGRESSQTEASPNNQPSSVSSNPLRGRRQIRFLPIRNGNTNPQPTIAGRRSLRRERMIPPAICQRAIRVCAVRMRACCGRRTQGASLFIGARDVPIQRPFTNCVRSMGTAGSATGRRSLATA